MSDLGRLTVGCVGVGSMGGALLVAHQNVMDGVIEHSVVDGHVGPARVAKDDFHPFALHAFP